MRKIVWALALALPFLAVPAKAHAWGSSGGFQISFNSSCNKNDGCGGGAPWYTYWPYDAYFQVPAMSQYPFWPAPMMSSMHMMPAPAPMAPPGAAHPAGPHQAVGYYSVWPSYWYGR